jgi:hypothetical protein
MRLKKTILLCSIAATLLFGVGAGIALFSGCDTVDSTHETQRDTATEDQINKEPTSDWETVANPDGAETDEKKNPEVSNSPTIEATMNESETLREPATEEPDESDVPETDSEDTTVEAPTTTPALPDFEEYCAMSAEDQMEFFESFASPADFFTWYNAAKEKYLEENPGIEIGPGGAIPLP